VKEILEKIAVFADEAHGEQDRKYANERYIQHPLRVMKACQDRGYSLPVLAAAILHDVLEDTTKTREEIKEFLLTVMEETDTDHTLSLVIELTDVYTKDNYPRLNRRKRKAKEINRLAMVSVEAQTIKYADIIDNTIGIAGKDSDFVPVFLKECEALLNKMQNGDPVLHDAAKAVIKKEMEKLNTHHLHS